MCRGKEVALLLAICLSTAEAEPVIDTDSYRGLVTDRRAYNLGDVITILVIESTTAQSQAETGANGSTKLSGQVIHTNSQPSLGLSLSGDTTGTGQTSRSGQVRANVGVRITEKLSGGLLRLAGEQTVIVNDEKQHIKISGVVRPDDISADNTVISYRLADANIEIVGDGVVAQAQKQNIIFRTLKWLRLI